MTYYYTHLRDREGDLYRRMIRGAYDFVQEAGEAPRIRQLASTEVMVEVGGVYVLTHACVLETACPACGAGRGELCRGPHGPKGSTHYKRRKRE